MLGGAGRGAGVKPRQRASDTTRACPRRPAPAHGAVGRWWPRWPSRSWQRNPAPRMRRPTHSCPSRSHRRRRPNRRSASPSARSRRAREPAVQRARAEYPNLKGRASVPTSEGDPTTFEVVFYTPGEQSQYGSDIRVEIVVSGLSGDVLAVWSGPQAAATLARGEEPSVGKSLNAPYVWLPLGAIFLAAFFDPRRPCRLLHLDLVVLLGFGLSQLYFNQGRIDVSMPIVYPLLAYLAVRTLLAGFRPRERSERLVPRLPVRWMAIGLVLLVACRVGLNLADSNVIDVGYASVVGADRIVHGEELYVPNDVHGDTYGPVNYLAYVPFET